jgi:hypothetical protein
MGSSGFLRRNGLFLVLFGIFVALWFGQSVVGHRSYNSDQLDHHEKAVTYGTYLTTAHFGEATFENWESEFLQMGAFVVLSVRLYQRGSPESKPMEGDDDDAPEQHRDDPGAPWPVRAGGISLALYKRSLSIFFFGLFLAAWFLHALTGSREFSSEELAHGGHAVSMWGYITTSQFWFESLQNWQSEFLAVAALMLATVWLRQQGSAQSKPVHEPHAVN